MKFEFTVTSDAFAEKYRDRLHTLLQGILTSNIYALEQSERDSAKVIRRGMDESAYRETQANIATRRAQFLKDFGHLNGFQE